MVGETKEGGEEMTIEFVTFEIAKKLKEKGFKEKCFAYYHPGSAELFFNHIPYKGGIVADCMYSYNSLPVESYIGDLIDAPTVSWALQWLREEKKIYVSISFDLFNDNSELWWRYAIEDMKDGSFIVDLNAFTKSGSYEEAALAGIEYVLDNLI